MKKTYVIKLLCAVLLCVSTLLSSCTEGEPAATAGDTSADTGRRTETEAEMITETETEAETEAPLPSYDDTHAYIFASSDKKTSWVVQGAETSVEFNVLKMVPTNHDPMIYCSFTEDERFDAEEYPFAAYRCNVRSSLTQGVFFVCSTDHPQFSDDGLTWIDVNNGGKWTNEIKDMRKNAFWEGTITAFRIDPINGGTFDKSAVIYLDRVGFFKTKEDAQAFLDDAKEADYSLSVTFSKGFAKAVVKGGTLSAGYDSADYLMVKNEAAEIKDGTAPVVVYEANGKKTVVPVCYVNSAGFVSYLAPGAGEYSLSYPSKKTDTDAGFVIARGVMTEDDVKENSIDKNTARRIIYSVFSLEAPSPEESGDDPADARFTAKLIGGLLKKYKLSVYTDASLSVKGLSEEEDLAVCCGVITDINASSLSGGEFASAAVRLIKAVLGQPVLKSNVSDKDGIVIGAWASFPVSVTDDTVKTFSEAGLSLLIDLGSIERQETLGNVLNSAGKYGVKVIRYNYSPAKFKASRPDAIPSSCYEYYDYDSYLGNLIYDEPGTDKYDSMAEIQKYYEASLLGKLCYYNLLPMYANAAQLKYGAAAAAIDYYDPDPELYKKYVEAYAEKIPGDYMCVDIYPYRSSGKSKTVYSGYLENMGIFASACRKYGRDFWLYIQSTDYDGGKWTPDYKDIIWQMYIGLSFGVKTFIHYQYCWGNAETFIKDGEPTDIYYAAKKADLEILALSDDYIKYKNAGAFTVNCEKAKFKYAAFSDKYSGDCAPSDIRSDDPLLFGCFEAKDGEGYAFTAVNMNDPGKSKTASVTFKVDGYSEVYAWSGGERVKLTPENGSCTLELGPAQGAFITVK